MGSGVHEGPGATDRWLKAFKCLAILPRQQAQTPPISFQSVAQRTRDSQTQPQPPVCGADAMSSGGNVSTCRDGQATFYWTRAIPTFALRLLTMAAQPSPMGKVPALQHAVFCGHDTLLQSLLLLSGGQSQDGQVAFPGPVTCNLL